MKIQFTSRTKFGLIAVLFLSTLLACQTEKKDPSQQELAKEFPHEWMYNQRAYPNNFINKKAMEKAVLQTRAILSERPENQGTDWELIGPLNTGGRITDIAISPSDDDTFFVTTPVGGVFKTTDRGQTWNAVFDGIGKPSIGNIAIAPSNENIIYVGTGEANGSATSGAFFGDGVYRSSDAGESWTHVGLPNSNHIGRIVIDPTDPDRVFAAATGQLYGKNDDRGIYKTLNGGAAWERVLFVTDSTAAIDVAMNPVNPDILFAAMWERTREPWQRDYGGETSAVHRSLDGGDTWTELGVANGLPAPSIERGRIGLTISAAEPSTVYARYTTNEITNSFDAIYKSTDNGSTWNEINTASITFIDASFGWYFGNIRVNPNDPTQLWVLGQSLYRTNNDGALWSPISGMHVDHHAMEFSTNNPNMVVAGNDGGAYISENGGNSWIKFTNLPITQFYNIEVDNLQPERLYGGTQDNNTIRTTTAGTNDWNAIWGGDGFHVRVDPNDNNYIYVESQYGNIGRSTDGGLNFSSATSGIDAGDRNNWNTPIELSSFDSETVYCGTQRLYVSDKAALWSSISPDLTDGLHPSGSLSYGTITAIGTSHLNLDTIYTGSDDGNLQVTFDGGTTWDNISNGLPDRYITAIAVSPNDDNIAYVTISGFGVLDYDPHVFKTIDGGQTWSDISSNLPSIPANDIIIDEARGLLLLATDLNVWYSSNDGGSWTILGNNLPLTIIRDLKLHEATSILYAGTFGRSMHQYDLSNYALNVNDMQRTSEMIALYPNPATDQFSIKHALNSEATIGLFDIQGKKIKTLYNGMLNPSEEKTFTISDLHGGIYLVQITTNGNQFTKRLVIE